MREKQIVYQYDGNPGTRDVHDDLIGEIAIPQQGSIIIHAGKRWKVVHVTKDQKLNRNSVPIFLVYLSSSLG